MPRAAVILTTGLLAVPGVVAAGAVSGAPGTTVPTTTTVVGATSTTVLVTTTVPRGGAADGSIAKPEAAEGWSIERLITLTALGIVALAASGYAFGRIRSSPPVHPDLVRHPD